MQWDSCCLLHEAIWALCLSVSRYDAVWVALALVPPLFGPPQDFAQSFPPTNLPATASRDGDAALEIAAASSEQLCPASRRQHHDRSACLCFSVTANAARSRTRDACVQHANETDVLKKRFAKRLRRPAVCVARSLRAQESVVLLAWGTHAIQRWHDQTAPPFGFFSRSESAGSICCGSLQSVAANSISSSVARRIPSG